MPIASTTTREIKNSVWLPSALGHKSIKPGAASARPTIAI